MKSILFDGRWVRPGMTGVGISAFNMLLAFGKLGLKPGLIMNPGPVHPELARNYKVFQTKIDLTHHPKTEFFEQIGIPLLCYRNGYNCFVSFEGRVPIFHFGIRTLSYINDLSYLKIRKSHNRRYSLFLIGSLLISRFFASRIICISKAVRDDMIRMLKASEKQIEVIPCADSGLEHFSESPVANLPKTYFLGIGINNPRKNLSCLLKGFQIYRQTFPDAQLVLTGNRQWIESMSETNMRENVFNIGFVSEGELRYLYKHATGLIYPSKDEGFGLPLMDAYRHGCPVFCSDIPVFKEVMGNYAQYFNPNSPEDLAAKLENGVNSIVGEIGLPQNYTWNSAALNLKKVSLVGEPSNLSSESK